jgi:hypothetical protein
VWITSLSITGVLSFDQFGLGLSERVTFIVGSNGAGKSNLTRLLTICLRAVESGDGGAGDVNRLLASFQAARHIGSQSPGIEARFAVKLTDVIEQALVTQFVRAVATAAISDHEPDAEVADLDAWANAEITEDKLQPLMKGEIVTTHPGTEDGRWQCAYEFTAPGHDQAEHRYQWMLFGPEIIIDVDAPARAQEDEVDIAQQVAGALPSTEPAGSFDFPQLLPRPGEGITGCSFAINSSVSAPAPFCPDGRAAHGQRGRRETKGEPGHCTAGHPPAGAGADQRHAVAAFRRNQLVVVGSGPRRRSRGAAARVPAAAKERRSLRAGPLPAGQGFVHGVHERPRVRSTPGPSPAADPGWPGECHSPAGRRPA